MVRTCWTSTGGLALSFPLSDLRNTASKTMKTISRRICGVLLGLGVLGLIVPVVRADEMADWMAEQRRQNDEYHRQWQQWREEQDRANQQAQAEQAARDRAYQEQQQQREAEARAQKEQEAWDKYNREWQQSQEEVRKWWDDQRKQKEWDEWHARLTGSADWSAPASNSTPANAPEIRPAAAGRIRFQRYAVAQQRRVILNPFALAKMEVRDQERVRQQGTLAGLQIIENPFVLSPK
jgi:hypothetical protein